MGKDSMRVHQHHNRLRGGEGVRSRMLDRAAAEADPTACREVATCLVVHVKLARADRALRRGTLVRAHEELPGMRRVTQ